ncbi:tyrosine-protein phosphatase [Thalassotalea agariperforans]
MIDIHCHYLPGIDDGPADMGESIALLELANNNGITEVILTPHIHLGIFDNNMERLLHAFNIFSEKVTAYSIPIKLHLGAEVRVSPDIMPLVEKRLLPFIGCWHGNDVLLLEMPHSHVPKGIDNLILWLAKHNIITVIAHPERNRELQQNPNLLNTLLQNGCLFQLTASSLLGHFGDAARLFAHKLLEKKVFQFMASDAHSVKRRPPLLNEAAILACSVTNDSYVEDLVLNNPKQLITLIN